MFKKKSALIMTLLIAAMIMQCILPYMAFASETPILYLFWGKGCPHCKKEKAFLEDLHQQYPTLEIRWFDVWSNRKYAKVADELRKAYGIKAASVPMTFIGEWSLVGFTSKKKTGWKIVEQIEYCLQNGCADPLDKIEKKWNLETIAQIRAEAKEQTPQGWHQLPPATSAAELEQ